MFHLFVGSSGPFDRAYRMTVRSVVDVEQNTPEWLEWRVSILSASDAPVIMNVAPSYWAKTTWEHLRHPDSVDEPTEQTRRMWAEGQRREALYRDTVWPGLKPVAVQRGQYGASLDLADLQNPFGATWWEIKSPMSHRSRVWRALDPETGVHMRDLQQALPEVWWQLVHQAHVVGDREATCRLIATKPGDGFPVREMVIPAAYLLTWWDQLEDEWTAFTEGLQPGIRDEAWRQAASDYATWDGEYKTAAGERKAARQRLITLAEEQPDRRAVGAGVAVTRVRRQGAVDYKTMARELYNDDPEAFELAAERYRRPEYTTYQIRVR